MEGLQDTILGEVYRKGFEEGFREESRKTEEEDIRAFADYLIEESKNTLTWDEALNQAKEVLSRKVPHIPTATSKI